MADHVNVQIIVQYVTDEARQTDRSGREISKGGRKTLEERINLVGDATNVFVRAGQALEVLKGTLK